MVNFREVVESCADPMVAGAALASIGGGVAAKVRAIAARSGVADGVIVAQLIREFRDHSCPGFVTSAEEAMRRSELPVLAGLQHILAHALARRALADPVELATMSETSGQKFV